MPIEFDAASVRFDEDTGLVPAVVQDASDGVVLMVGYMNDESLARTLETGKVTFWSRSRARLWEKGETSGNTLRLQMLGTDCDGDALLVTATAEGPTCHTGDRSCFGVGRPDGAGGGELGVILADLTGVIEQRARERPDGSYTTALLDSGIGRVAQKVAEEAVETALAAVAEPERIPDESADLLYHLLVLWEASGVSATEVAARLSERRGPQGSP
jgi:phosphoribosyl-ATP pyrophosphohydrolase/phosphoribosyl-AMP cyclohydrolase